VRRAASLGRFEIDESTGDGFGDGFLTIRCGEMTERDMGMSLHGWKKSQERGVGLVNGTA